MKTSRLTLLLCAITTLFISSCVNQLERRISSNPKIYHSLSSSDQRLVQQGRIREGMAKEGVFLALGHPDQVASGRQRGADIEKWTYFGSRPVYINDYNMGYGGLGWGGMGMGMGWGGYGGRGCGYSPYGYGYSPSVMYVPYKAVSVTFRGNRVSEYLTGPQ